MKEWTTTVVIAFATGLLCMLIGAAVAMSWTSSQYNETLDYAVTTMERQGEVIAELVARIEASENSEIAEVLPICEECNADEVMAGDQYDNEYEPGTTVTGDKEGPTGTTTTTP